MIKAAVLLIVALLAASIAANPYLTFLDSDDVQGDEFRANAAAFFAGLLNDPVLRSSLNGTSPEEFINVYDRARYCDDHKITSGFVQRLGEVVVDPDLARLLTGLELAQNLDLRSCGERIRAEPGLPACLQQVPPFDDKSFALRWLLEQKCDLNRDVLLGLVCCGVRFGMANFL